MDKIQDLYVVLQFIGLRWPYSHGVYSQFESQVDVVIMAQKRRAVCWKKKMMPAIQIDPVVGKQLPHPRKSDFVPKMTGSKQTKSRVDAFSYIIYCRRACFEINSTQTNNSEDDVMRYLVFRLRFLIF